MYIQATWDLLILAPEWLCTEREREVIQTSGTDRENETEEVASQQVWHSSVGHLSLACSLKVP